jgi:hypothetical protein
MRQNTIDMVIVQWSGDVVGIGVKTTFTHRLYINHDRNIRVRQVTSKDIVASGGLLTQSSLKLGPFTPKYPGGGLDNPDFDPPVSSKPQEVFFLVKGLGMGRDGRWFKRFNDQSIQNYSSWLFLESTGEQAR